MNIYPSPVGEDIDSSEHFFARDSQPLQMEHEMQSKADAVAQQAQEQTPQEHHPDIGLPDVLVPDLQLAAQLGHDFVERVASSLPPTASSDIAMEGIPVSDAGLRAILPYPEADPEHDAQAPHGSSHAPGSESETDVSRQLHHYESGHQQPEPLTLAMPTALDHLTVSSQYTAAETPPRKRSKVSRACDECRRKKVKCDAQTDTGDMPCSNCKRGGFECLFSRIPQKRGPSKGYIKELADRIGSIEQLVQAPGEERTYKRSFSSMSTADAASPVTASRPGPWSAEQRGSQSVLTSRPLPARYQTPYSPNDLMPPLATSPQQETSPISKMSSVAAQALQESSTRASIDHATFNQYLDSIHPHLPFLPGREDELQSQLARCELALHDAFNHALRGAVASFPAYSANTSTVDTQRSHQLLDYWLSSTSGRNLSPYHLLTYVQALLLMTIEADNRPPGVGGPSKDVILSAAIKVARRGGMHDFRSTSFTSQAGSEPGPPFAVIRLRTWCSLVVLDRFDGFSSGCQASIELRDVVLPSNLLQLVGDNLFSLLRLTALLGHISGLTSLTQGEAVRPQTPLESFLLGAVPQWLEDQRSYLPDHIRPEDHPIVHLQYWHAQLLTHLFDIHISAKAVLHFCEKIVQLLVTSSTMVSPFNHHYIALVTLILLELAEVDTAQEVAKVYLADLTNNPIPPSSWNSHILSMVHEKLDVSPMGDPAERTVRENLRRLARAATSTGSKPPGSASTEGDDTLNQYKNLGFNPMWILSQGYLALMRESA